MSNRDVSTRRYYYLRNAYIGYKNGNLTVNFGVSDGLGHANPMISGIKDALDHSARI
ncbi:MAG: hypothetical protein R2744_08195 [Bacteroidales bacterium]